MQPAIHSKEKVTMDVIKAELKVDPLALETSEDTDKEEKKPILEGVQISTQIKRECDDNSCNLISGMKYETQIRDAGLINGFLLLINVLCLQGIPLEPDCRIKN
ncbi:uncharacterized protein [Periplaneta americana]|uniref:uncharacterized protein isoform X7 n=1 Tax=Periplaneta americana TaxID=6978 RepID=UPI0037E83690